MSLKRVKLSEQERAWKSSSLGEIARELRSIKPQNKREAVGRGWVEGVRGEKKTV